MPARNHGTFTGTAAAMGTINGTSGRNIVIKITVGGAETVSITGAIHSTTVSGKIMLKSLLTGALHSTVDMASGTYFIENCPVDSLIFLGSAAVETKTVEYSFYDLRN